MTIRLRFEDFDAEGERVFLGGRIIFTRDILSVVIQKRVSAALLGYLLISGFSLLVCVKVSSGAAIVVGLLLAVLLFTGAAHERRNPYVLVLKVRQLGTFEVTGIPETALPALDEFVEGL